MIEYIRKNKEILLLLYIPVYMLIFFAIEATEHVSYWDCYMKLDDYIPFCEWFVIPYVLWYPFLIGTALYLYFKDRRVYLRYALCFILGFSAMLAFFVLFPNEQNLRVTEFANDNVFTRVLRWIYNTDNNKNVFPSGHVLGTLFAAVALSESKAIPSKSVKTGIWILALAIILSTVFVKQHSFLDILGGLGFAAITYAIVYGRRIQYALSKSMWNSERNSKGINRHKE